METKLDSSQRRKQAGSSHLSPILASYRCTLCSLGIRSPFLNRSEIYQKYSKPPIFSTCFAVRILLDLLMSRLFFLKFVVFLFSPTSALSSVNSPPLSNNLPPSGAVCSVSVRLLLAVRLFWLLHPCLLSHLSLGRSLRGALGPRRPSSGCRR